MNRGSIFSKALLLVLFFVAKSVAQPDIRCGNQLLYNDHKYLKALRKESVQLEKVVAGVVKIPVVVHVIHNKENGAIGGTNISEDLIRSQIKILNEDYRRKAGTLGFNSNPVGADMEIEFQLATSDPHCNPTNGIIRYYVPQSSFSMYDPVITKGRYWPRDQYLNIWVCNLSGGFLGYAQLPDSSGLVGLSVVNGADSTDGIVIRYNAFGLKTLPSSTDHYAYGRTVTHEVGHWFGLMHPFAPVLECDGFDGLPCCGDDYCDDTPRARESNPSTCAVDNENCNADGSNRMIENYMDYFPDLCMNTFTEDQKARTRQVLSVARARNLLINSKGKEVQSLSDLPYSVNLNRPLFFLQSGTDEYEIKNNITIDLSGFIDRKIYKPLLVFDYKYENPALHDTILISDFRSCLNGPYVIKKLSSDELSTPLTVQGWRSMYVPLYEANADYVKPRMQLLSYGGTVKFKNMRIINISDELVVQLLQNPSLLKAASVYDYESQRIAVEVLFEGTHDIEIDLLDTMGRKIMGSGFVNQSSGRFELFNAALAAGIYFVRITASGQTKTNKILVI